MANVPLELRKVSDGGSLHPAINKHWVEDVKFLCYGPPPDSPNMQELATWMNLTELQSIDLELLLSRPCHVFWSQILYDQSLTTCLDSFLKLAPRELDGASQNKDVSRRLDHLRDLYFKVFLRLMTCKESQDDFFKPEIYGELLYENFILDIPKIIDLCVLYKSSNAALLQKMVENVFKCQPKYTDDLKHAVTAIEKVFRQPIDNTTACFSGRSASCSADEYMRLCLLSTDLPHSVFSFLDIYPPASLLFNTSSFYQLLSSFFEDCLCTLLDQLDIMRDSKSSQKQLYRRLTLAKEEVLKTFRLVLYNSTIGKLIVSRDEKLAESTVQEFCDVLTEHLGDIRLMAKYEEMYPLSEDISMLDQMKLNIDDTRFAFIRDGLTAAVSHNLEDNPPGDQNDTPVSIVQSGAVGGEAAAAAYDPRHHEEATEQTPVQAVKDVFPELGDGFVETCLGHYGAVECVINALLEDNLPPHIAALDRTAEVVLDQNSLLNTRRNVFDNDEFDVFHKKSVDTSKIHKGKRDNQLKNDDESLKIRIKELASNYDNLSLGGGAAAIPNGISSHVGSLAVDVSNLDMYYEYDDEYDDTYDANEVGADDADEAQDLMGRKMVVPQALRGDAEGNGADNQENDAEDGANQGGQSELGNQGKPKHDGHRPHYDVKGGPKGQGQSHEVVRNRQFKTQHKSRGANHNRKAGSRAKMSKGMF